MFSLLGFSVRDRGYLFEPSKQVSNGTTNLACHFKILLAKKSRSQNFVLVIVKHLICLLFVKAKKIENIKLLQYTATPFKMLKIARSNEV